MADKKRCIQKEECNVFLDFQIIKDSNTLSLTKELDVLIASGKKIYVWSKVYTPNAMKNYCSKIVVPTPKDEFELHKQVFLLKNKERKTYEQISQHLKIPINKVSYFSKNDPLKQWTLNDWILGYYTKDSSTYQKADIIVDTDQKIVDRFIRAGKTANLVKKII